MELGQIVQMQAPVLFAQVFIEEAGQLGVGDVDPAARGYAVGHVGEAFGEHFGKVGEDGSGHQVGVDFRHAVDFVRTDDCQPCHADAAAVVLIDDGHAADEVVVEVADGAQGVQEVGVDFKDDVQMARQQAAHQIDRPSFQGFAHQGVVGVRENLAAHIPCFGPRDAFFVNQDAHQLGNRQHGVGIVQVDGGFVGKVFDAGETAFVARHDVLYGCGNKEIFLFQAQFAAAVGGVVRIEDARDVFIAVLRTDGGSVIAAVEVC